MLFVGQKNPLPVNKGDSGTLERKELTAGMEHKIKIIALVFVFTLAFANVPFDAAAREGANEARTLKAGFVYTEYGFASPGDIDDRGTLRNPGEGNDVVRASKTEADEPEIDLDENEGEDVVADDPDPQAIEPEAVPDENDGEDEADVDENETIVDDPLFPRFEVIYALITETPATMSALPAQTSHFPGEAVLIEEGLTTEETSRDGVPGVWTFDGWTTNNAIVHMGFFGMPSEDILLAGAWTFTPSEEEADAAA